MIYLRAILISYLCATLAVPAQVWAQQAPGQQAPRTPGPQSKGVPPRTPVPLSGNGVLGVQGGTNTEDGSQSNQTDAPDKSKKLVFEDVKRAKPIQKEQVYAVLDDALWAETFLFDQADMSWYWELDLSEFHGIYRPFISCAKRNPFPTANPTLADLDKKIIAAQELLAKYLEQEASDIGTYAALPYGEKKVGVRKPLVSKEGAVCPVGQWDANQFSQKEWQKPEKIAPQMDEHNSNPVNEIFNPITNRLASIGDNSKYTTTEHYWLITEIYALRKNRNVYAKNQGQVGGDLADLVVSGRVGKKLDKVQGRVESQFVENSTESKKLPEQLAAANRLRNSIPRFVPADQKAQMCQSGLKLGSKARVKAIESDDTAQGDMAVVAPSAEEGAWVYCDPLPEKFAGFLDLDTIIAMHAKPKKEGDINYGKIYRAQVVAEVTTQIMEVALSKNHLSSEVAKKYEIPQVCAKQKSGAYKDAFEFYEYLRTMPAKSDFLTRLSGAISQLIRAYQRGERTIEFDFASFQEFNRTAQTLTSQFINSYFDDVARNVGPETAEGQAVNNLKASILNEVNQYTFIDDIESRSSDEKESMASFLLNSLTLALRLAEVKFFNLKDNSQSKAENRKKLIAKIIADDSVRPTLEVFHKKYSIQFLERRKSFAIPNSLESKIDIAAAEQKYEQNTSDTWAQHLAKEPAIRELAPKIAGEITDALFEDEALNKNYDPDEEAWKNNVRAGRQAMAPAREGVAADQMFKQMDAIERLQNGGASFLPTSTPLWLGYENPYGYHADQSGETTYSSAWLRVADGAGREGAGVPFTLNPKTRIGHLHVSSALSSIFDRAVDPLTERLHTKTESRAEFKDDFVRNTFWQWVPIVGGTEAGKWKKTYFKDTRALSLATISRAKEILKGEAAEEPMYAARARAEALSAFKLWVSNNKASIDHYRRNSDLVKRIFEVRLESLLKYRPVPSTAQWNAALEETFADLFFRELYIDFPVDKDKVIATYNDFSSKTKSFSEAFEAIQKMEKEWGELEISNQGVEHPEAFVAYGADERNDTGTLLAEKLKAYAHPKAESVWNARFRLRTREGVDTFLRAFGPGKTLYEGEKKLTANSNPTPKAGEAAASDLTPAALVEAVQSAKSSLQLGWYGNTVPVASTWFIGEKKEAPVVDPEVQAVDDLIEKYLIELSLQAHPLDKKAKAPTLEKLSDDAEEKSVEEKDKHKLFAQWKTRTEKIGNKILAVFKKPTPPAPAPAPAPAPDAKPAPGTTTATATTAKPATAVAPSPSPKVLTAEETKKREDELKSIYPEVVMLLKQEPYTLVLGTERLVTDEERELMFSHLAVLLLPEFDLLSKKVLNLIRESEVPGANPMDAIDRIKKGLAALEADRMDKEVNGKISDRDERGLQQRKDDLEDELVKAQIRLTRSIQLERLIETYFSKEKVAGEAITRLRAANGSDTWQLFFNDLFLKHKIGGMFVDRTVKDINDIGASRGLLPINVPHGIKYLAQIEDYCRSGLVDNYKVEFEKKYQTVVDAKVKGYERLIETENEKPANEKSTGEDLEYLHRDEYRLARLKKIVAAAPTVDVFCKSLSGEATDLKTVLARENKDLGSLTRETALRYWRIAQQVTDVFEIDKTPFGAVRYVKHADAAADAETERDLKLVWFNEAPIPIGSIPWAASVAAATLDAPKPEKPPAPKTPAQDSKTAAAAAAAIGETAETKLDVPSPDEKKKEEEEKRQANDEAVTRALLRFVKLNPNREMLEAFATNTFVTSARIPKGLFSGKEEERIATVMSIRAGERRTIFNTLTSDVSDYLFKKPADKKESGEFEESGEGDQKRSYMEMLARTTQQLGKIHSPISRYSVDFYAFDDVVPVSPRPNRQYEFSVLWAERRAELKATRERQRVGLITFLETPEEKDKREKAKVAAKKPNPPLAKLFHTTHEEAIEYEDIWTPDGKKRDGWQPLMEKALASWNKNKAHYRIAYEQKTDDASKIVPIPQGFELEAKQIVDLFTRFTAYRMINHHLQVVVKNPKQSEDDYQKTLTDLFAKGSAEFDAYDPSSKAQIVDMVDAIYKGENARLMRLQVNAVASQVNERREFSVSARGLPTVIKARAVHPFQSGPNGFRSGLWVRTPESQLVNWYWESFAEANILANPAKDRWKQFVERKELKGADFYATNRNYFVYSWKPEGKADNKAVQFENWARNIGEDELTEKTFAEKRPVIRPKGATHIWEKHDSYKAYLASDDFRLLIRRMEKSDRNAAATQEPGTYPNFVVLMHWARKNGEMPDPKILAHRSTVQKYDAAAKKYVWETRDSGGAVLEKKHTSALLEDFIAVLDIDPSDFDSWSKLLNTRDEPKDWKNISKSVKMASTGLGNNKQTKYWLPTAKTVVPGVAFNGFPSVPWYHRERVYRNLPVDLTLVTGDNTSLMASFYRPGSSSHNLAKLPVEVAQVAHFSKVKGFELSVDEATAIGVEMAKLSIAIEKFNGFEGWYTTNRAKYREYYEKGVKEVFVKYAMEQGYEAERNLSQIDLGYGDVLASNAIKEALKVATSHLVRGKSETDKTRLGGFIQSIYDESHWRAALARNDSYLYVRGNTEDNGDDQDQYYVLSNISATLPSEHSLQAPKASGGTREGYQTRHTARLESEGSWAKFGGTGIPDRNSTLYTNTTPPRTSIQDLKRFALLRGVLITENEVAEFSRTWEAMTGFIDAANEYISGLPFESGSIQTDSNAQAELMKMLRAYSAQEEIQFSGEIPDVGSYTALVTHGKEVSGYERKVDSDAALKESVSLAMRMASRKVTLNKDPAEVARMSKMFDVFADYYRGIAAGYVMEHTTENTTVKNQIDGLAVACDSDFLEDITTKEQFFAQREKIEKLNLHRMDNLQQFIRRYAPEKAADQAAILLDSFNRERRRNIEKKEYFESIVQGLMFAGIFATALENPTAMRGIAQKSVGKGVNYAMTAFFGAYFGYKEFSDFYEDYYAAPAEVREAASVTQRHIGGWLPLTSENEPEVVDEMRLNYLANQHSVSRWGWRAFNGAITVHMLSVPVRAAWGGYRELRFKGNPEDQMYKLTNKMAKKRGITSARLEEMAEAVIDESLVEESRELEYAGSGTTEATLKRDIPAERAAARKIRAQQMRQAKVTALLRFDLEVAAKKMGATTQKLGHGPAHTMLYELADNEFLYSLRLKCRLQLEELLRQLKMELDPVSRGVYAPKFNATLGENTIGLLYRNEAFARNLIPELMERELGGSMLAALRSDSKLQDALDALLETLVILEEAKPVLTEEQFMVALSGRGQVAQLIAPRMFSLFFLTPKLYPGAMPHQFRLNGLLGFGGLGHEIRDPGFLYRLAALDSITKPEAKSSKRSQTWAEYLAKAKGAEGILRQRITEQLRTRFRKTRIALSNTAPVPETQVVDEIIAAVGGFGEGVDESTKDLLREVLETGEVSADILITLKMDLHNANSDGKVPYETFAEAMRLAAAIRRAHIEMGYPLSELSNRQVLELFILESRSQLTKDKARYLSEFASGRNVTMGLREADIDGLADAEALFGLSLHDGTLIPLRLRVRAQKMTDSLKALKLDGAWAARRDRWMSRIKRAQGSLEFAINLRLRDLETEWAAVMNGTMEMAEFTRLSSERAPRDFSVKPFEDPNLEAYSKGNIKFEEYWARTEALVAAREKAFMDQAAAQGHDYAFFRPIKAEPEFAQFEKGELPWDRFNALRRQRRLDRQKVATGLKPNYVIGLPDQALEDQLGGLTWTTYSDDFIREVLRTAPPEQHQLLQALFRQGYTLDSLILLRHHWENWARGEMIAGRRVIRPLFGAANNPGTGKNTVQYLQQIHSTYDVAIAAVREGAVARATTPHVENSTASSLLLPSVAPGSSGMGELPKGLREEILALTTPENRELVEALLDRKLNLQGYEKARRYRTIAAGVDPFSVAQTKTIESAYELVIESLKARARGLKPAQIGGKTHPYHLKMDGAELGKSQYDRLYAEKAEMRTLDDAAHTLGFESADVTKVALGNRVAELEAQIAGIADAGLRLRAQKNLELANRIVGMDFAGDNEFQALFARFIQPEVKTGSGFRTAIYQRLSGRASLAGMFEELAAIRSEILGEVMSPGVVGKKTMRFDVLDSLSVRLHGEAAFRIAEMNTGKKYPELRAALENIASNTFNVRYNLSRKEASQAFDAISAQLGHPTHDEWIRNWRANNRSLTEETDVQLFDILMAEVESALSNGTLPLHSSAAVRFQQAARTLRLYYDPIIGLERRFIELAEKSPLSFPAELFFLFPGEAGEVVGLGKDFQNLLNELYANGITGDMQRLKRGIESANEELMRIAGGNAEARSALLNKLYERLGIEALERFDDVAQHGVAAEAFPFERALLDRMKYNHEVRDRLKNIKRDSERARIRAYEDGAQQTEALRQAPAADPSVIEGGPTGVINTGSGLIFPGDANYNALKSQAGLGDPMVRGTEPVVEPETQTATKRIINK